MYPRVGKILGGFHHRVVWILKGHIPHQNLDRKLTHPPLGMAMEEFVVQDMKTYATRCQNTITQFIVTIPIMEIVSGGGAAPSSAEFEVVVITRENQYRGEVRVRSGVGCG